MRASMMSVTARMVSRSVTVRTVSVICVIVMVSGLI